MMNRLNVALLGAAGWVGLAAPAWCAAQGALPGFERGAHHGEQVRTFSFEPDVRVVVNAPAAAAFAEDRPVRLVVYALPNGNTIEQTAGKRLGAGDDWHFDIQHIAAQTRQLRSVMVEECLVVAYVEAGGLSWPSWRKKHEDNGALISRLVEELRGGLGGRRVTVDLAAHSGGGSFVFGFINHHERIPEWVGRIVLLDANYGYSDGDGHGDKLLEWLQRSPGHFLGVIAYDDRNIELNGKKVVGPTGGTWRRTLEMIARASRDLVLRETVVAVEDPPPPGERREAPAEAAARVYRRVRGLGGRCEFVLHENPDNRILHTVLVEVNGFIHGMTFGTKWEGAAGVFREGRAYGEWIQPE